MKIDQFKDIAFKKAIDAGFSDCELYYDSAKTFQVRVFQGEVSEYKNSDLKGISFRGTYNGKVGYSYSEKVELNVIDFLIDSAKQNAEILEEAEEKLYAGDPSYPEICSYNEKLNDVSTERKIELAKTVEKIAYATDSRVKSVDYCMLSTGDVAIHLCNSLGLNQSAKQNYALAYVGARVEQDGQAKVGGEYWIGTDLEKFSPEDLAKKAVQRALSYLGATSIKSGKYPAIFTSDTANEMLSAFLSVFFAETVQKGFSLLKGKLNQKIANDVITIRDDGTLASAVSLLPFDSEGVSVKDKIIIEDGVLKTYLYNLKSAAKDSVQSTGNGFKASFKSSVSTAATNFYIKPSDISKDQLMQQMGDGLIITELAGLHSGTNAISGDFSLSADGYLIEGGKIIRPVEQITIAGNFFELLLNTVAVADDLRFDTPSGSGTVGSPSLYVKEIAISGS